MSCSGLQIQARRNADLRITYAPNSRKFSFANMSPLLTVRLGDVVKLSVSGTATVNGSVFSVVGDAVVLTITKEDIALLDSATPDTEKELLNYDVVFTDQTGFENWILGGQFVVLGINDTGDCGCSGGDVEISLGGECVEISIDGGNVGVGSSVSLAELNQAVQDSEAAASSAELSAAQAAQALVDINTGLGSKADVDADNIDAGVWRTELGLGNSATLNVGTAAGTVAAGDDARFAQIPLKANTSLDNVTGDTFNDKTGTIYSYGQATRTRTPVPKSISDRFAEYASTEDFGVRLYQSGNSGPLQDNTAALQEAVDKIQARDGCLWVPNYGARYGSTTVLTDGLTMRSGTFNGIDYDGKGFALIGEEPGDRSAWAGKAGGRYDGGQGFKHNGASNKPLITSPAGAGILVMENLLLSGGGVDARGIELSNASGLGVYGLGAHMKQVYINGFGRSGLHIGSARGRGTTEWVWVEYCGSTSAEPGWAQLAYDWEHYSVGVGVNSNTGIYVGNGSQVRFIGGASWMNEIAVQVDSSTMDVDFIGFHFDNSNRSNLVVNGYNGSGRKGGRRFVACRFSGASMSASNTHAAVTLVNTPDGDTIFTAPDFMGGSGGEAELPNYLVNADANSIFNVDTFAFNTDSNKPYATAPINDWGRVRLGGTGSTSIGMSNGGDGMTIRAGGIQSLEVRPNQVAVGGLVGAAPFQAETVSGGVNNRITAQSTSADFNFALLRALANNSAAVDLALQGSNGGRVRFGTYASSADAAITGYVTISDDAGVARKLAIIS